MLFGCKPESSEQTPQAQLEYQREVENTLNELDRSIEALQAKAATVAEESKAEFNAMLSDLQQKRAQARAQLGRVDEFNVLLTKSTGCAEIEISYNSRKINKLALIRQHALEKMKAAGTNAWQDIRAEVDETVEDLRDTYDRTVSRFQ